MELVGCEDDETRSSTSFSSWVVHMSVENNTNVDDGFILGDEFLTEDELTNESNEDSGEEFGVYSER